MNDDEIHKYIEHPEEDGETRSFEEWPTTDSSATRGRALVNLMTRVSNFELQENKQITRVFITIAKDSVLCEVFYKDK